MAKFLILNDNQDRVLTMGLTVKEVNVNHPEVISAVPALGTSNTKATAKLDAILALAKDRSKWIVGSVEVKHRTKLEMCDEGFAFSSAIYSYAFNNNMPDVMKQFDFTVDKLKKQRYVSLGETCMSIYDFGFAHKTEMAERGYTETRITEFGEKVLDFKAIVGQSSGNRTKGVNATAELKKLFEDLKLIYEEDMDKLVEGLKQLYPTYYGEYQQARKVLMTGIRHEEKPPQTNPPENPQVNP